MSAAVKEIGGTNPRRFKPYPAYKDSGIEWLGEIPTHWTVTKLKRIGSLQAGAGFPDDEQGVATEEIPFFKVGDMGTAGNKREMIEWQHTVSEETARRLRAYVFPPNTIVFAKVGAALLLNRRRLLTRRSCLDNNMMGFTPGACDVTWAFHWLSGLDLARLANPGAVPSVNEGQMRDTPVVLPPENEQRAIATLLDRETAKIDALVATKEQQIDLLQEKRTSLITRAVTKGLDPNVPMKDSGVEWLGEIPASWEMEQIKRVARVFGRIGFRGYTTGDLVGEGEGALTLGASQIADDGSIDLHAPVYLSWAKYHESPEIMLANDDLLVVQRGSCGRVGHFQGVEQETTINPSLVVLKRLRVLPRFLFYVLNSDFVQRQFSLFTSATAVPMLSQEQIGNVALALPDPGTQDRIAAFLDAQLKFVDAAIGKIREGTACSREFRSALISAAVTGKIDVREEAA